MNNKTARVCSSLEKWELEMRRASGREQIFGRELRTCVELRSAWKAYNLVLQCGGWLRVQWFYKSGCLITLRGFLKWIRLGGSGRLLCPTDDDGVWNLLRLLLRSLARCWRSVSSSSFSPRLCRFWFKHSMRGHSSNFLYPLRWFFFSFLSFFSRWSDRDSRPTTPRASSVIPLA